MRPGCFYSSLDYIASLSPKRTNTERCNEWGWARAFMRQVNVTWPHVHHVFFNLGRAAASIHVLANEGCLEERLPRSVDLLLVQDLPEGDATAAEQLYTRVVNHLLRSGGGTAAAAGGGGNAATAANTSVGAAGAAAVTRAKRASVQTPAVIFINSMPIVDYGPDSNCFGSFNVNQQSFEDPPCCANLSRNHFATTYSFAQRYPQRGHEEEPRHQAAAYYGFAASLSLRNFLFSALRDDVPAVRRLNMSTCRFLCLVYGDRVHPRPPMGHAMYADMLLHVLRRAEASYLEHFAASGAASPADYSGYIDRLPAAPAEPFAKAGRRVVAMKCWEPAEEVLASASASSGSGSGGPAALELDGQLVVNTTSGGLQPIASAVGAVQMLPLHEAKSRDGRFAIINNKGFHVASHSIAGGHTKIKPGLVAVTPGSAVTFRINTIMEAPHGSTAGDPIHTSSGSGSGRNASSVVVQLSYLRSYAHMGRARIACDSGCACAPVTIDGHLHKDRVSMSQIVELVVSKHPACVITVIVLPDTASGENKVKLTQVTLKSANLNTFIDGWAAG